MRALRDRVASLESFKASVQSTNRKIYSEIQALKADRQPQIDAGEQRTGDDTTPTCESTGSVIDAARAYRDERARWGRDNPTWARLNAALDHLDFSGGGQRDIVSAPTFKEFFDQTHSSPEGCDGARYVSAVMDSVFDYMRLYGPIVKGDKFYPLTLTPGLRDIKVERLVLALHDAIGMPKGVVPASADEFYRPAEYYGPKEG